MIWFFTVLEYYDLLQFATVLSEADSAEASGQDPVKGFLTMLMEPESKSQTVGGVFLALQKIMFKCPMLFE